MSILVKRILSDLGNFYPINIAKSGSTIFWYYSGLISGYNTATMIFKSDDLLDFSTT